MFILIEPLPCPRPRITARGKFAHAYYPASYKAWRQAFASAIPLSPGFVPHADPVSVMVTFVCPRPKTTKLQTPKGDIDNYLKSLFDSLTDLGVWDDDKLVETVHASKRFALTGEPSGIQLEIIPRP
jgi:Holliday junction resolvase RusA-like endonuclease